MNGKHKILNVKPFQGTSGTCEEQIICSMLQFYDRSILEYLSNYIYRYQVLNGTLTYSKVYFEKNVDVYKRMNLTYRSECLDPDFLIQIIEKINAGIPVGFVIPKELIAGTNVKYSGSPIRFHHILIYGYDDKSKCINIIDQKYDNSLQYSYKQLSYHVLYDYAARLNQYQNDMLAFFYYFEKYGSYSPDFSLIQKRYINHIISQRDLLSNSILSLRQYLQSLDYLLDHLEYYNSLENISKNLFEIASKKKTLLFVCSQLLDKRKILLEGIERLVVKVSYIASFLLKLSMLGECSKASKEKINASLQELLHLEDVVLKNLINF